MAQDRQKKNKRDQKWKDENRDRINLLFRKGTKEQIRAAAAASGLSMAQWVQSAIDEKLAREE